MVLEYLNIHIRKKVNIESYFEPYTKISSTSVKCLNRKVRITKSLEKHTEIKFCQFEVDDNCLHRTQKHYI